MTLKELWDIGGVGTYSTDKESTHHYLDVYDKLFVPFQDREINLLEVGYGEGGSIDLWLEYFKKANITVIDINDYFRHHRKNISFIHENINRVLEIPSMIDIAIDDGSHFVQDQIVFINLVYPKVNSGGLIIIEDVHDIENNKKYFDELNIPFEIIDLRKTGVHCSVLLIFRK